MVERIKMMAESMNMQQRRESILLAAQKVFNSRGYSAATVEEVAVEAGVAKGSVYNYFNSKQALFNQVFQAAMTTMQADCERIVTSPASASERLGGILDFWFRGFADSKQIGRLVLEYWATAAREQQQGELAEMFQAMYARWRELLSNVISDGIESGEFGVEIETPVAASLVLAILDGIHVQSILDVGINVNEQFLAALKKAILTGLQNPNGQARRSSTPKKDKTDDC